MSYLEDRRSTNYPEERMLRLWEEGHHSDVTVRTLNADFDVHKAILCQKSEFFFKALNGDWKEAKANVVNMKHDSPATIKAMLKFMYVGEYDLHENDVPFADQLADHADMHAVGLKYNVAGLAEIAARNFDHVFCDGSFREQIEAVNTTIPFLCETIPRIVRSEIATDVANFAAENLDALLENEAFQEVITKFGGFSLRILDRVSLQLAQRQPLVTVAWGKDPRMSTTSSTRGEADQW